MNQFFGTPRKVERATYIRTEQIFHTRTYPWLESLEKYVSSGARCLIVGCGGGIEIEWFAKRCAEVVGIDISPGVIEQAALRYASVENAKCVLVDENEARLPFEDESFDIVFLHDVAEHLIAFEACFAEYHRVLKPNGILINSFSPLFYSPFGAHLQDALKIPWGHLIFGFETVRDVRNKFYPGISTARSWEEFGLNRLTERRYRQAVGRLGFIDEDYSAVTSKGLPVVGRIPILRNLFILEVRHIGRKSVATKPSGNHS